MSVDNFTASLIEMAEAVKAKPELEKLIADLKAELNVCYDTISVAKLNIANLETELAEAKAKREEAIRERDDACFRNLELDEKLDQFASMAGKVLGLVRPTPAPVPAPVYPEPAPVAVAEPVSAVAEPAEYDWRTEAASTEPVALPAWDAPAEAPAPTWATKPGDFHEYPYSWKSSSMTDEEWAFGGGRPGNPPATGTDPLSW